jgi:inhibitor of KinA
MVVYGNVIDINSNKICHVAGQKIKQQQLPFIKDIIPTYSSVAIQYNFLSAATYFKTNDVVKKFTDYLQSLLKHILTDNCTASRKIKIPVCYQLGLDNEAIAIAKNISTDALVEIHTQQIYQVFMLGFLPGFAYMGLVDERIAMPRLSAPRNKIESGSVGIAGKQTGIYPLASPGGWNIIGITPLNIFQPTKENSCLLEPGDEIQFYPISLQEFESIKHGN